MFQPVRYFTGWIFYLSSSDFASLFLDAFCVSSDRIVRSLLAKHEDRGRDKRGFWFPPPLRKTSDWFSEASPPPPDCEVLWRHSCSWLKGTEGHSTMSSLIVFEAKMLRDSEHMRFLVFWFFFLTFCYFSLRGPFHCRFLSKKPFKSDIPGKKKSEKTLLKSYSNFL